MFADRLFKMFIRQLLQFSVRISSCRSAHKRYVAALISCTFRLIYEIFKMLAYLNTWLVQSMKYNHKTPSDGCLGDHVRKKGLRTGFVHRDALFFICKSIFNANSAHLFTISKRNHQRFLNCEVVIEINEILIFTVAWILVENIQNRLEEREIVLIRVLTLVNGLNGDKENALLRWLELKMR